MKRKELATSKASKMTAMKRGRSSAASSKPAIKKKKSPSNVSTPATGSLSQNTRCPRLACRTEMASEAIPAIAEAFPYYKSGRALIHLRDNPKPEFQLHKAVLERNSSWFAGEFAKNKMVREGFGYRFTLNQPPGHNVPFLIQTVMQNL